MKYRKKKRVFISILLVIAILTGGCGSLDEIIEKDDSLYKTLSLKDVVGGEGIYILGSDNKVYQTNTDNQTFSNTVTSSDTTRLIYSVDGNKYIPTLYKDDYLIYVCKSEIPAEFEVERFSATDNTIGISGIKKSSEGTYTFSPNRIVVNSNAYDKSYENLADAKAVTILSINGNKNIGNMLSEAGTITGLEKGKNVDIELMRGTIYSEGKIEADTKFYYSVATATINTYTTTKNGYIILKLPDNITKGYISVDGRGLMRVSDESRSKK